ncbi:MAG: hypothetical protein RDV41_03610 [Planctomycetota bacterium]|nr:hypothetical protein [Planctomycetota bacterium]
MSQESSNQKSAGLLFVAAVVGWLVPGAGFIVLGRFWKGLCLLILIGGTFAAGAYVTNFRGIAFDDNQFYYVGRFGSGLLWFLSFTLLSPEPRGLVTARFYEAGTLYMSLAGLLNLFVLLNLPFKGPSRGKAVAPQSTETQSSPP